MLLAELVQLVVVIRRKGGEAYRMPCLFSRRARGCKWRIIRGKLVEKILFPLKRAEPSVLPFAVVRRLLFSCTYLYIVNSGEVNRPQSTEHAKYAGPAGRNCCSCRSFFSPVSPYPITYKNIYIHIIFEIPFLLYTHSSPEIPDNP